MGRIAGRHPRFQVEIESDSGELVNMVDRQPPDRSLRIRHGLIRDDSLCARRLEIEAIDVPRLAALFILRFNNYFVLINRRLDEIGVVLGIGIFKKLLYVRIG